MKYSSICDNSADFCDEITFIKRKTDCTQYHVHYECAKK